MERGTNLKLKFPQKHFFFPAVTINRSYGWHSAKLYLGILTLTVRAFPHLLEDNKHTTSFVSFITGLENITLSAFLGF